jgi:hypothetical protein
MDHIYTGVRAMSSLESFEKAPYRSIKNDSYFPVYDKLLSKYIDASPTVVEVGILGGGSLFTWRDFFGPNARIIGVELNPAATKWRDHGFEIFIGDQSSDAFWDDFFGRVGDIDILIDDGGHTNYQQLKTLHKSIPHIKPGGVVIIEDTQASYMKHFGNPTKYSFMNFCGAAAHKINDRYFYRDQPNLIRDYIHSMEIFEGIAAFHVNQFLCFRSKIVVNEGADDHAIDLRAGAPEASIKPKGLLSKIRRKFFRKLYQLGEKLDSLRKCKQYF